ncbi:MAG: hypothetical protein GXZ11_00180 [Tissierellia bacterium]|nr:hypothetical protein [Tissierellia bacterium]
MPFPEKNISVSIYALLAIILNFSEMVIEHRYYKLAISIIYVLIYFIFPGAALLLPLFIYDIVIDFLNHKYYGALSVLAIFFNHPISLLFLCFMAAYLGYTRYYYLQKEHEAQFVRDNMMETTLILKQEKNKLLQEAKQNERMTLLEERNRISSQLHNSVGHTISGAILQGEALKAICGDDSVKDGITAIQNNLKSGMSEIRQALHQLKSDSIDLKDKITELFEDSRIKFDIQVRGCEDLSFALKYELYTLVREAHTNAIKHSNATEMIIRIIEQTNFISIYIKDNGSIPVQMENIQYGIGLLNLNEFCDKYQGILNLGWQDGFRIYISIKKVSHENNNNR